MVKETSKQIAQAAWEQESQGLTQTATQTITSQVKAPAKPAWTHRLGFVVPIIQEKTAPLVEGIKAKLPFHKAPAPQAIPEVIPDTQTPTQTTISSGVDPFYRKYRCLQTNPLGCEWTQKTLEAEPKAKYCLKCSFPVIFLPKQELRGYKVKYQIESYFGHRGMGRLYRGIQAIDQQTVIIKEYLLPNRCFNEEEIKEQKQAFERLAGLSLADGRSQDIRLIVPWDAFCDQESDRCYLVTNSQLDACPTLRTYLTANGAIASPQVRRILEQVLQTLQFLHGQKFRLPSGNIQPGIAHGNISLDSLLIMAEAKDFFIHVCDLALWENLFNPPTIPKVVPTVADDLKALGYVAFYLLAGGDVKADTCELLEPLDNEDWGVVEPTLKAFIMRLLGFDKPFVSAEEARLALLQLPPLISAAPGVITGVTEVDNTKLKRPPFWLFGILGLLLLSSLVWLVWQKLQEPEVIAEEVTVCCLQDVPAVPAGKYSYASDRTGTWGYILRSIRLILKNQTLEERLKKSQPKLQLIYQPEDSSKAAIEKVKLEKVDFAVTSLVNNLTPQLQQKEIAYDGLVVFVAFSYTKRDKSLPKALNGTITIKQIRDLYTGKITNWRKLSGVDLPVKLYIPPDKEAIHIFEQRVLKNKNEINNFRKLQAFNSQFNSLNSNHNTPEKSRNSTLQMLQNVFQDFENNNIGSIGFTTLSQVFGQCSAYPLALIDDNKAAVQPLIKDNGKDIDASTDLCDDKGSYHPNIQVFKNSSYPLAYPIVVVYPADNSRVPIGQKFADMLRTQEVQQLLSKSGLVPLNK